MHTPSMHGDAVRREAQARSACLEIRYESLFYEGRGLSFPCDADGHVPLDSLSERALEKSLYARAVVGREYASPSIRPAASL